MNKLFMVLGLATILGLSACNKCYECDYGTLQSEFCSDDYSGDELDDLESACENSGGDWHLSVD